LFSTNVLSVISYLLAGMIFIFFLVYTIQSILEHEQRAALRALILAILLPLPYAFFAFVSFSGQQTILTILIAMTVLTGIYLLFPFHRTRIDVDRIPAGRIDERDIMFSRRLYEKGTERYRTYYRSHPEYKSIDDGFRANPGLLGKGSRFYHPLMFAAANASFISVTALHSLVENETISVEPVHLPSGQVSRFIKNWAKKLGAYSVGITTLRDYHLYSHVGRGPHFGREVQLPHTVAVAFTVEMDKTSLDYAPYGPTVMESARKYMDAGAIAVQIAEFIKQLGYSARAHIDGNYRVVCPLVARDAGLGELGRMGLLMTPTLGPRVRIGVVTTDYPLLTEQGREEWTVQEFCARCKKCADACPSKAISFDDPKEINGVVRWKIDQEKCYTYWTEVGTDCARCVAVCPYSHPDNLLHNLVRKGLKQSSAFQWMALKMDDFFYGRKPTPRKPQKYLE